MASYGDVVVNVKAVADVASVHKAMTSLTGDAEKATLGARELVSVLDGDMRKSFTSNIDLMKKAGLDLNKFAEQLGNVADNPGLQVITWNRWQAKAIDSLEAVSAKTAELERSLEALDKAFIFGDAVDGIRDFDASIATTDEVVAKLGASLKSEISAKVQDSINALQELGMSAKETGEFFQPMLDKISALKVDLATAAEGSKDYRVAQIQLASAMKTLDESLAEPVQELAALRAEEEGLAAVNADLARWQAEVNKAFADGVALDEKIAKGASEVAAATRAQADAELAAARATKAAFDEQQTAIKNQQEQAEIAASMLERYAVAEGEVGEAAAASAGKIESSSVGMSRAGKNVEGLGGKLGGFMSVAAGMAAFTGFQKVTSGISNMFQAAITRSVTLDAAQVRLSSSLLQYSAAGRTVAATQKQINAVMNASKEMTKGTQFQASDLADAFSRLAAAGIPLNATMTQVGQRALKNTSVMEASGKAIEGVAAISAKIGQKSSLSDIATIFSQISDKGHVMQQQLRALNTKSISATQAILEYEKKVTGNTSLTVADVTQEITKGTVSYEEFVAAIYEKYGQMGTAMNDTILGSFLNLKGSLARIGADFTDPILKSADVTLQGVYSKLDELDPLMKRAGTSLASSLSADINSLSDYISTINVGDVAADFEDVLTTAKAVGAVLGSDWQVMKPFVELAGDFTKGLQPVLPLVTQIGVGIATWKMGNAFKQGTLGNAEYGESLKGVQKKLFSLGSSANSTGQALAKIGSSADSSTREVSNFANTTKEQLREVKAQAEETAIATRNVGVGGGDSVVAKGEEAAEVAAEVTASAEQAGGAFATLGSVFEGLSFTSVAGGLVSLLDPMLLLPAAAMAIAPAIGPAIASLGKLGSAFTKNGESLDASVTINENVKKSITETTKSISDSGLSDALANNAVGLLDAGHKMGSDIDSALGSLGPIVAKQDTKTQKAFSDFVANSSDALVNGSDSYKANFNHIATELNTGTISYKTAMGRLKDATDSENKNLRDSYKKNNIGTMLDFQAMNDSLKKNLSNNDLKKIIDDSAKSLNGQTVKESATEKYLEAQYGVKDVGKLGEAIKQGATGLTATAIGAWSGMDKAVMDSINGGVMTSALDQDIVNMATGLHRSGQTISQGLKDGFLTGTAGLAVAAAEEGTKGVTAFMKSAKGTVAEKSSELDEALTGPLKAMSSPDKIAMLDASAKALGTSFMTTVANSGLNSGDQATALLSGFNQELTANKGDLIATAKELGGDTVAGLAADKDLTAAQADKLIGYYTDELTNDSTLSDGARQAMVDVLNSLEENNPGAPAGEQAGQFYLDTVTGKLEQLPAGIDLSWQDSQDSDTPSATGEVHATGYNQGIADGPNDGLQSLMPLVWNIPSVEPSSRGAADGGSYNSAVSMSPSGGGYTLQNNVFGLSTSVPSLVGAAQGGAMNAAVGTADSNGGGLLASSIFGSLGTSSASTAGTGQGEAMVSAADSAAGSYSTGIPSVVQSWQGYANMHPISLVVNKPDFSKYEYDGKTNITPRSDSFSAKYGLGASRLGAGADLGSGNLSTGSTTKDSAPYVTFAPGSIVINNAQDPARVSLEVANRIADRVNQIVGI